jgi:hypothetical protein
MRPIYGFLLLVGVNLCNLLFASTSAKAQIRTKTQTVTAPTAGNVACPGPDCDMYAQIALATGCSGNSEYPFGYGKKYCDRFTAAMNDPASSSNMKCWICGTRQCLLESLTNNVRDVANDNGCSSQYAAWKANPNPTTSQALQNCIYRGLVEPQRDQKRQRICEQIKTNAFNAHSICYRKSGLYNGGCDLTCVGYADLLKIPGIPDISDLATIPSLKQCVETGIGFCTDLYDAATGSTTTLPGTQVKECIKAVE